MSPRKVETRDGGREQVLARVRLLKSWGTWTVSRWSVWSWRCPQRFEKLDENPTGEVAEEAGGEGRKLGGEDSIKLGLSRRESTRCRSLASRERSEWRLKFLQNPLEVWKILLRRILFCLDLYGERKRVKETENLWVQNERERREK